MSMSFPWNTIRNAKITAAVFVVTLGISLVMFTSAAWAAVPNPGPSGSPPSAPSCSKPRLFGVLVPWYEYLDISSDSDGLCKVNFPSDPGVGGKNGVLGAHSAFFLIVLAVGEDLVRIAALVAVGYILYGGTLYMTSGGSPDATKKAQNTVINSLIGLTIAILATSIVSLIGHKLGA
jgi:hypothetical protein